jgi:hypothetical protein
MGRFLMGILPPAVCRAMSRGGAGAALGETGNRGSNGENVPRHLTLLRSGHSGAPASSSTSAPSPRKSTAARGFRLVLVNFLSRYVHASLRVYIQHAARSIKLVNGGIVATERSDTGARQP